MRYKNKFSAVIAAEDGLEGLTPSNSLSSPSWKTPSTTAWPMPTGNGRDYRTGRRDGGDVVIMADKRPRCPKNGGAAAGPELRAAPATKGSGIGLRNGAPRASGSPFGEEYGLAIPANPTPGHTCASALPVLEGRRRRPCKGGRGMKAQDHAADVYSGALGLGVLSPLWPLTSPAVRTPVLLEVSVIIREADSTGWSAARQGMEPGRRRPRGRAALFSP
jgi:hypothetical protein